MDENTLYASSTFPITQIICPHSKFCITFFFHFSRVLQPSQGKLKTMLIRNVWGANKVIMGNVEVACGRIALAVATILDKSPGQYCNIHILLWFLGSLLKQCILFEIFLQFFFPPSYTKLKLWIHASKIVCGVRGLGGCTSVNWKRPQKCKSVPRLLSMIVGPSLVFRDQGFSLFEGRDSGLRVCRRCRMPKITIEITGWREKFWSGLRHNRTLLGTLYMDMFWVMGAPQLITWVITYGRAARGNLTTTIMYWTRLRDLNCRPRYKYHVKSPNMFPKTPNFFNF